MCSKSAISLQWGPVDPKFRVEGLAATNHSSQKTRLNFLSQGIKIWTEFSSVCHNDKQTDRRTDRYGRTDRILIVRPRLHSMQRGKNA